MPEGEMLRSATLLTDRIDAVLQGSELDTNDPDAVAAVARAVSERLTPDELEACARLGILAER